MLEPTVIFLIGAAASGKSTIGKLIASKYHFCYLDKDMICNKFTGQLLESKGYSPHERDGNDFYSNVVMDLEYQTLLDIANDNLQLGQSVILDAPFLAYFSDSHYIHHLKEKYNWTDVKPLILQVTIDFAVLKERMQARELDRDIWKFDNWNTYVESIKERKCLWEGAERRQFDNSSSEIDEKRLYELLSF
jgi:predicted kinase